MIQTICRSCGLRFEPTHPRQHICADCEEGNASISLLGETEPDPVGAILGTGYYRFSSPVGIDGLCKVNGGRLDLLAVISREPSKGHLREFLRQAKEHYRTVCVWHVDNPALGPALERYGFTPETEIQPDGEIVPGYRWDKKP